MGMRFLTFSTPPQRECDFFHFVNTSPARSSEMMSMPFSNHCFGVTLLKAPNVNRHKNPRLLWQEIYDTKIVLCKKLRILFGIIYFPMNLNNSNKLRYAKIYEFFQELFIFFKNCNNSAWDVFLLICNSTLTVLSEQNQVVECKSTLVRQHFQVKNA